MTTRRALRSSAHSAVADARSRGLTVHRGRPTPRAAELASPVELGGPASSCDLLVVQGHPLQAQLVAREALRAIPGLDVCVQRRRDDAIALLNDLARAPGLVLLDPRLPDGDGLDILRAIRAEPRIATTPVVITARAGDDPAIQRALRDHANAAFIVRDDLLPFTDALRYLVRYWFRVHAHPHPSVGRDTGAQMLEMT